MQKIISDIEVYLARPAIEGKHPTIYEDRAEGKFRIVMRVRICDYQFCPDGKWVLPNPKMGLSFSASWENLKFVYGLHKKRAKKKPVNIYWILSEADIPKGLAFKKGEGNSGHYVFGCH